MPELLGQLLDWGRETLRAAGLDDFGLSAELLLQSVLGISRTELLLGPRTAVDDSLSQKYKNLIAERARRVPLQYLLGEVEFHNVRLKVDRRALIPRPETEILVETVIGKLSNVSSPSIIDLGTGSGNIAIALAKNIPGSFVTGVDISAEALELARENAGLNGVTQNTRWLLGDIKSADTLRTLGEFDCVVANPPYVADAERGTLQPEVIEHEPNVALFSGDEPLIFFREIIANSLYILKTGGLLAFEVGMGQAGNVADMMAVNFSNVEIARDLAGIERVVTGVYAGLHQK